MRSREVLRWSTSPQDALKHVKKLVAAWPHANPPNAAGWAASLAAALEPYPLGLVDECCDPRTGLAQHREFPPTVAAVTEWCNRRLTYHRGIVRWADQEAAKRPEFPAEHRQGMLKRLQNLLHGLFDKPQQQAAE